jgi:ankyrin repeat protein
VAKLSIAQAKQKLAGTNAASTLADVERALGSHVSSIHRLGTPVYVFELSDGEIRVASRDRATLKSVRVFVRPAGLPAGARLDDHGEKYEVGESTSTGAQHGPWEYYSLDGKLLERVTYRDGQPVQIEEQGADGQLARSIEPLCGMIQLKKRGEVVKLLAAGSPVGTYQGMTALHHLAQSFRDAKLAQQIIAAGVPVDARSEDDQTPLHLAIYWWPALTPFVEALVDAGADLDALCGKYAKDTVLHMLCHSKNGVLNRKEEELAVWLIERGANPDVADSNGQTARQVAVEKERTKILAAMASSTPGSRTPIEPSPPPKAKATKSTTAARKPAKPSKKPTSKSKAR